VTLHALNSPQDGCRLGRVGTSRLLGTSTHLELIMGNGEDEDDSKEEKAGEPVSESANRFVWREGDITITKAPQNSDDS